MALKEFCKRQCTTESTAGTGQMLLPLRMETEKGGLLTRMWFY